MRGSDLFCLLESYVLHVGEKATEAVETSFIQNWETRQTWKKDLLGDRRMSKPVLLGMGRKGEKMEEERVWKHNGKGR